MKTVQLREVSKSYDRTFALHRVSTSFHAGTMTALLGGNGAGKTTLLNILATLDTPSNGSIHYDKIAWKNFARKHRTQIGWVSHDSLIYDELTGRENLEFYARMYGISKPEQLTEHWLKRVGLTDAADRRASAYSRGMRQRLTIARALLHEPRLVLLDEPTTGLDQNGIRDVSELFTELRNDGRIVVLITHDHHVLDGRIDRLVILKRGKLTFDDHAQTAAEILDAYQQFS